MRWQHKLFGLAIGACLAFLVLTTAAMVVFPGGTIQNHSQAHYLFFENPLSDLGRTRLFDGRSNLVSMTLFVAAMLAGGAGLAAFFVAFAWSMRESAVARVCSGGGAVLGIVASACFVGVACTPWDLYMRLHIQFVLCAFRSLLLATVLNLIATVVDDHRGYRLIGPFVAFIVILFGYIILLTAGLSGGPASDAVIQATGQKIVVYAALIMVIVQSRQMRQRHGASPL
jgi:hypothetical protein